MLPHPTQHLVNSLFATVNGPKYTRNTSLYRVTDYVAFLYYEQQLTGYNKIILMLLNK